MQSDWTTCLSPEQLDAFLTHASSGRVLYVVGSLGEEVGVHGFRVPT